MNDDRDPAVLAWLARLGQMFDELGEAIDCGYPPGSGHIKPDAVAEIQGRLAQIAEKLSLRPPAENRTAIHGEAALRLVSVLDYLKTFFEA